MELPIEDPKLSQHNTSTLQEKNTHRKLSKLFLHFSTLLINKTKNSSSKDAIIVNKLNVISQDISNRIQGEQNKLLFSEMKDINDKLNMIALRLSYCLPLIRECHKEELTNIEKLLETFAYTCHSLLEPETKESK